MVLYRTTKEGRHTPLVPVQSTRAMRGFTFKETLVESVGVPVCQAFGVDLLLCA